ncbi:MAG TPA: ABC transporter ATP-binding protein [Synergistaceae bacterium]|nr:ABC transporter ATP-binding protein [Synergistaceae bacterium]
MLRIEDLHVYYGAIHAVKGISIAIPKGGIVTLIGANGAGKSSTIRSIAGLVKNVKGRILYTPPDGTEMNIAGRRPEDMVRLGIAMSPEGRRILPHLTVEENLKLGAYIRTDTDGVERDRDHVYELFPRLKERSWQKGGTLSGGEQQMLAVGRALMARPKIMMMDEPSLGLAPLVVRDIFEIIKRVAQEGITVLLIEQNANAALRAADYGYVMETGLITLEGTGEELLNNPQVRDAYLGSARKKKQPVQAVTEQ